MEAPRISTESTALASSRAATRTWSHPAPFRFLRAGGCVLFAGAIVFEHAERLGISVMLKLQETENDQDMDGGDLGTERKLYLREIVARFGHLLAVHFNLGEENSQTPRQVRDMARWVSELDPYGHLVTIHNQSPRSEPRLEALLGPQLGTASRLTGASIQANWDDVHRDVLHWITRSEAAGRPWSVSNDEQGTAHFPEFGNLGMALDEGSPFLQPRIARTHRPSYLYCMLMGYHLNPAFMTNSRV